MSSLCSLCLCGETSSRLTAEFASQERLHLVPKVRRLLEVHRHRMRRPPLLDRVRQRRLDLRVQRDLVTGPFRQLLFHVGAKEEVHQPPRPVGIGTAADHGHAVRQKQRPHAAAGNLVAVGEDDGDGTAGLDLLQRVVGVGDGHGDFLTGRRVTGAGPLRRLLVARRNLHAVGPQAVVVFLRLFRPENFKKTRRLRRRRAELRPSHCHAALPLLRRQVEQAPRPVGLLHQLGVDQQDPGAGRERRPVMVLVLRRGRVRD